MLHPSPPLPLRAVFAVCADYRHMCHFFTNLFFLRPELQTYDYVWRMDANLGVRAPASVEVGTGLCHTGGWVFIRGGMYPMWGPVLNGVGIGQRMATPCVPWMIRQRVQRRWAGESTWEGGCTKFGLV